MGNFEYSVMPYRSSLFRVLGEALEDNIIVEDRVLEVAKVEIDANTLIVAVDSGWDIIVPDH